MKPRTVTLPTVDHGLVTVTCPDWCTGQHDEETPVYRADIHHEGPEIALSIPTEHDGDAVLLQAGIESRPYSESEPGVGPFVVIDLGSGFHSFSSAGVDRVADALVNHASRLRYLARRLDVATREAQR